MATSCPALLRGKTVRLTELDCGTPVTGSATVSTDAFITVTFEPEYEEGSEVTTKNANGDLCVNERAPDALKRVNVTIDFCKVHPEIFEMVAGATLEMDGEDVVGFRISEGTNDQEFSFELWTGTADSANCQTGGEWGYFLLPRLAGGTWGELTIEDGSSVTFQLTGYTLRQPSSGGWGFGPFDVVGTPAGPLDVAITNLQHFLLRTTTVAPPAAACGAGVVS